MEKKPQVLVVDDELDMTEIISLELQGRGYKTVKAFTGNQAQLMMKKLNFDWVISDIKMPDGNGFSLAKWVSENYPKTKVILVTGYPEITSEDATKEGALGLFQKPIDFGELGDLMDQAAEKAS